MTLKNFKITIAAITVLILLITSILLLMAPKQPKPIQSINDIES